MPRRTEPDPFAEKIGHRIRALRKEQNLTLEKLAYESDLGSKGHLSDIERGRTVPRVSTLRVLAERLECDVLDLVTFPEDDARQALVDLTRALPDVQVRRIVRELRAQLKAPKPVK